MKTNLIEKVYLGWSVFLAGVLTLTALLHIHYGIDNLKMIRAFQSDEGWLVDQVERSIQQNEISPQRDFNYGFVYQSCAVISGLLYKKLGYSVSTSWIALTLRLLSLIGALGSVAALLFFMKIWKSPNWLLMLAGFLILSEPDFYFWAQTIHPDTFQMMFLILGISFAFYSSKFTHQVFSAILLGLAFGTKFGGIFGLPFLIILPFFREPALSVRETFRRGILLVAIFGGVFAITNPYAFIHLRTFLAAFQFNNFYLHGGQTGTGDLHFHLFAWLKLYVKYLGTGTFILLALGGLLLFLNRKKQVSKKEWKVLAAYLALCFFHLVLCVRRVELRYSFHVFPILLVLLSGLRYLNPKIVPVALTLFMGLFLVRTHEAIQRTQFHAEKNNAPLLQLNAALEKRFPKDILIFQDWYTYTSPEFKNFKLFYGLHNADIENNHPQVLIFSKGMTGRWVWKAEGTSFASNALESTPLEPAQSTQAKNFLSQLLTKGSGWSIVYEGEELLALERSPKLEDTATLARVLF